MAAIKLARDGATSEGLHFLGSNRGLRRGETCDGHAERRTRDVVETALREELDRDRFATVLTANPNLQVGARGATALNGHLDELPDAVDVDDLERIVLQHTFFEVRGQELTHVIARVTERHLRQVIRTEREELGVFGDFIRQQRRASCLLYTSPSLRDS